MTPVTMAARRDTRPVPDAAEASGQVRIESVRQKHLIRLILAIYYERLCSPRSWGLNLPSSTTRTLTSLGAKTSSGPDCCIMTRPAPCIAVVRNMLHPAGRVRCVSRCTDAIHDIIYRSYHDVTVVYHSRKYKRSISFRPQDSSILGNPSSILANF